MGRGSNHPVAGNLARRETNEFLEIGEQVVRDVIESFVSLCLAQFPRDATLRVLDRKGRRRVLIGDEDVTHMAGRIVHFSVPPRQRDEAWNGPSQDLVRLIAVVLYCDSDALRYAGR